MMFKDQPHDESFFLLIELLLHHCFFPHTVCGSMAHLCSCCGSVQVDSLLLGWAGGHVCSVPLSCLRASPWQTDRLKTWGSSLSSSSSAWFVSFLSWYRCSWCWIVMVSLRHLVEEVREIVKHGYKGNFKLDEKIFSLVVQRALCSLIMSHYETCSSFKTIIFTTSSSLSKSLSLIFHLLLVSGFLFSLYTLK